MKLDRLTVIGGVAGALLISHPATAQISRLTTSIGVLSPPFVRGTDVAYDPVNQVYCIVGGYGPIYGVFVNTSGGAISAFGIGSTNASSPFGHFPRVEYSRDANGGQGGFLVTWHQNDAGSTNFVHDAVIAYPVGVIPGSEHVVSDGGIGGSFWEAGAAIAYSATSHRFLVAWQTRLFGVQARFVDSTGAPISGVITFEGANARDPGVAWNPTNDTFGLSHSGWTNTQYVRFRTISAGSGAVLAQSTFGNTTAGTFNSDVDVNLATHHFVVAWATGAGSFDAEFDENGTLLGAGLISTRFGGADNLTLAYNPVSGTFLAVGQDITSVQDAGAELNAQGTPTTGAAVLTNGATGGSFYPRVAARTDAPQWDISYSRDFTTIANQIVGSSARVVTSAPPPPPAPPPPTRPDITIFRPGEGNWYSRTGSTNWAGTSSVQWGIPGDIPLKADFDGDGRPDMVVYRPSEGMWYVLYSSTNFSYTNWSAFQWGIPGDIPVPGDFDGDGKADLVVFRPSNATWYGRFSSTGYSYGSTYSVVWGQPGDVPLAADFDGDHRADVGIYRPSDGTWWVLLSSRNYSYGGYVTYQWGVPGDVPMAEDFDGDGRADLAVYRPGNATWFLRYSSSNYGYDNWAAFQWGLPGDIPIAGDFDGDGKADLVVWRPTDGYWYLRYSSSGYSYGNWQAVGWGITSDMPIGGAK
jgi:hypothetical protein